MASMFNSIQASRELEGAGATKPLAEAIAIMVGETIGRTRDDLVTKDFLKAELAEIRTEFRTEIATVRTEIATAKNETVRWLIGSQVVLIVALIALMNLGKLIG